MRLGSYVTGSYELQVLPPRQTTVKNSTAVRYAASIPFLFPFSLVESCVSRRCTVHCPIRIVWRKGGFKTNGHNNKHTNTEPIHPVSYPIGRIQNKGNRKKNQSCILWGRTPHLSLSSVFCSVKFQSTLLRLYLVTFPALVTADHPRNNSTTACDPGLSCACQGRLNHVRTYPGILLSTDKVLGDGGLLP